VLFRLTEADSLDGLAALHGDPAVMRRRRAHLD
jgi:hypothetical protein